LIRVGLGPLSEILAVKTFIYSVFLYSILYSRCKTPCDGKIPCVRTCDEDPKLSLENWINSSLSTFLEESMFETHLTKAGAIERQCSKSDKYHRRVLNPKNRCRHSIYTLRAVNF
jgi:hypothetical protein